MIVGGKIGMDWDSRNVDQMGINLQLVDAIYTCGEGCKDPELASSPHYTMGKGPLRPQY